MLQKPYLSLNFSTPQFVHHIYVHHSTVCILQLERQFEQALKKSRGMVIHRMKPDGACLFRAVGESAPTPPMQLFVTLLTSLFSLWSSDIHQYVMLAHHSSVSQF